MSRRLSHNEIAAELRGAVSLTQTDPQELSTQIYDWSSTYSGCTERELVWVLGSFIKQVLVKS